MKDLLEEKICQLADASGIQDGSRLRCQLRAMELAERWGGKDDAPYAKWVQRFRAPLCHSGAEQLVKETLGLPSSAVLKDHQIQKAVLAACFASLRQSVGSCFATAPAILIHEENKEQFLADLYELLMTGKLKRTFGGVEHVVPLSPSSGVGDLKKRISPVPFWLSPGLLAAFEAGGVIPPDRDLEEKLAMQAHLLIPYQGQNLTVETLIEHVVKTKTKEAKAAFKAAADNPLLKAWEFTLASFSEIKMEFSRWNLYSSLGFHPQESGGLGEKIYIYLEKKLEEHNEKLQHYQNEYQAAFDQLKATETLFKGASSESEARRLKAEHQSRLYHMQACLEMRDTFYLKASNYASFFSVLIRQYDEKFPEYFQEIYDAEMFEFTGNFYDDSPAGFRLVYKHGRSDASLWSFIYDEKEWTSALVHFFLAVEHSIAAACTWEGADEEVAYLTTEIVSYVRSREFLESALSRSAKQGKKPWAYISGGTMSTLVKTYYKREAELTEESRWMESETDLLVFIIDALKNLSPLIMEPFVKNPNQGMLMFSPTHAFVLHPGWSDLKGAWEAELYTYSWVRDQLILPAVHFYQNLRLTEKDQRFLLDQLNASGSATSALTVEEFRSQIRLPQEARDAFLFQALRVLYPSCPKPFLFADTNWPDNAFAFLVNPGTLALELWRCNRSGTQGVPMNSWKRWLNGTERLPWGIYTRPHEYGAIHKSPFSL